MVRNSTIHAYQLYVYIIMYITYTKYIFYFIKLIVSIIPLLFTVDIPITL